MGCALASRRFRALGAAGARVQPTAGALTRSPPVHGQPAASGRRLAAAGRGAKPRAPREAGPLPGWVSIQFDRRLYQYALELNAAQREECQARR